MATTLSSFIASPRTPSAFAVTLQADGNADALPRDACREILYNVISDAACAVVLSIGAYLIFDRWLGVRLPEGWLSDLL